MQLESKGKSRDGLRNSHAQYTRDKLRQSTEAKDYDGGVLFENINGLEPVKVGQKTEAHLERWNAPRLEPQGSGRATRPKVKLNADTEAIL